MNQIQPMTLNWKKEDINIHTSRLLDLVVNLANEDEVITPDEEALIEVCRKKIWTLESEFGTMIDDGWELDKVRVRVKEMLKDILNASIEEAKKDNKISSDELYLIDKLAKFIRENNFAKLIQ